MEITCKWCGETKPAEEFHRNKKAKNGRYSHCKACALAADRKRRGAPPPGDEHLGPILGPTRANLSRRRQFSDRLHADRGWLFTEYELNQRTLESLAVEAGCATSTIASYLHFYRIKVRSAAQLATERRGQPRPGAGLKGPAHFNWRGGKSNACPTCGKPKSKRSKQCLPCARHAARGPAAYNWGGSDVGYATSHQRVKSSRGSASTHRCAHCDKPAQDWAYDHKDPDEKYNEQYGGYSPYSTKIEHYFPLCKKCHSRFDLDQIHRMIREGGSNIVESDDPPAQAVFSFHWLAGTARNNKDLWVGADGSITIRGKATYQAVGLSPDFKGLMCQRIDIGRVRIRRAA